MVTDPLPSARLLTVFPTVARSVTLLALPLSATLEADWRSSNVAALVPLVVLVRSALVTRVGWL